MLYIVVPVHNRAPVTTRFIEALVQQNWDAYHLVLVDDGCTDDTVTIARDRIPTGRLTVLRGDGQLWWAGALQLAWCHLRDVSPSDADAVLIINDDVGFDAEFLTAGMSVLREHPDACIQAVGVDRLSGIVDRGAVADLVALTFRAAMPGELANCLSTRGLLMSAETFLCSGGFRPRRLPHYLSDYEFTLRLARAKTPLLVDDRFRTEIELSLTGLERPTAQTFGALWTQSFSNRAKFNPRHWSAFVLMACPATAAPRLLARIWLGWLRTIAATVLKGHGELRT
jgi:GT2 family glycosyltransferase